MKIEGNPFWPIMTIVFVPLLLVVLLTLIDYHDQKKIDECEKYGWLFLRYNKTTDSIICFELNMTAVRVHLNTPTMIEHEILSSSQS